MFSLEPLADPTRLRIVRHLAEHGSASLRELAAAADVHLNTARPNVVELEGAGVLQRESTAPSGPGRPAVRYRLVEGWSPPSADFRGLAEVLGAALVRAGFGADEIRAVGHQWGRYLLGRPGAPDVERELAMALERLGFQVTLSGSTLRLSACPCSLVLPQRPQLVCELAVAVADGVLAGAGSDVRVGRREHDPVARSCVAQLEAPPAEA
jgi:predicted ArsR family transcriptional regulator